MATNMEELEKKMEMKIEGVRAMMLDGFSAVDRKLTAIEELLKKIVESQNQDKGKTVAIRGGDGGPAHESRPENPWRSEISWGLGDQRRQGRPWEAGNPYGWVGLYTHHYGKDSPQGTDVGRGKGFCGPAWMGQSESDENDTEKGWGSLGKTAVKTGQDEKFKDSLKYGGWRKKESWVGSSGQDENFKGWLKSGGWGSKESWVGSSGQDENVKDPLKYGGWGGKESWVGSSGEVADKTDAGGGEEEQTSPWASWGNKKHDKAIEPDQGANKHLAQVAGEGSKEEGHEEGQKPGSWGSKEEGLGSKRKDPGSPVEGPNDGPKSSGPLTATRQRLSIFTTDEQEILNKIEPIMQSIRRIMHEEGYNDGDPLSADDQTYILDNVFNHHPSKAQKLGAGLDYIMVSKYMNVQGSRCFYIVSKDGRKDDFSYNKCLKNYVRGKYPGKADKFIPKYFKNSEPRNRDRGSGGPHGPGTPRPWSGWDREARPAWGQTRAHPVGTKQKRARWPQKAAH